MPRDLRRDPQEVACSQKKTLNRYFESQYNLLHEQSEGPLSSPALNILRIFSAHLATVCIHRDRFFHSETWLHYQNSVSFRAGTKPVWLAIVPTEPGSWWYPRNTCWRNARIDQSVCASTFRGKAWRESQGKKHRWELIIDLFHWCYHIFLTQPWPSSESDILSLTIKFYF